MADMELERRTQEPTPHRREEARRHGNVPRSRDLTASLAVLSAFLLVRWLGPDILGGARRLVESLLGGLASSGASVTAESVSSLAASCGAGVLLAILPLAGGVCLVSTAAGILQGGSGVRFASLGPDFSRIDPFEGARKLLQLRSATRGGFALAKIGLVAWLVSRSIEAFSASDAASLSVGDAWVAAGRVAAGLGLRVALGFVALAALDYAFQRWQHERELRMTRAEILEEVLRLEGDPELKRRRRRVASGLTRSVSASRGKED